LYTTPPKKKFIFFDANEKKNEKKKESLFELNLVPAAIIFLNWIEQHALVQNMKNLNILNFKTTSNYSENKTIINNNNNDVNEGKKEFSEGGYLREDLLLNNASKKKKLENFFPTSASLDADKKNIENNFEKKNIENNFYVDESSNKKNDENKKSLKFKWLK
jgi:hypothetical protein